MTFNIAVIQPIGALIASVLILLVPRLLNYVVAIYLMATGIKPLATLIPPHSALRLGDLRHSTSNDELDAIEAFMWLIRTAVPVMMRRALETSAQVWGTGSSSTGSGSTRSRR
jgi:hypothetical protein